MCDIGGKQIVYLFISIVIRKVTIATKHTVQHYILPPFQIKSYVWT